MRVVEFGEGSERWEHLFDPVVGVVAQKVCDPIGAPAISNSPLSRTRE